MYFLDLIDGMMMVFTEIVIELVIDAAFIIMIDEKDFFRKIACHLNIQYIYDLRNEKKPHIK